MTYSNMNVMPCGTCGELVLLDQIKYWTPDQTVVFCGAKCSCEYFEKNNKDK